MLLINYLRVPSCYALPTNTKIILLPSKTDETTRLMAKGIYLIIFIYLLLAPS
jgi:hypothetical protein